MIYPFDKVRRFSSATSYYCYIISKSKFPQISGTLSKIAIQTKNSLIEMRMYYANWRKAIIFFKMWHFQEFYATRMSFFYYIKRSHILMLVALQYDFLLLFILNYFTNPKCFNASKIACSFSSGHFGCLESSDFGRL